MTSEQKAALYRHDLEIFQEENNELRLEVHRLKKQNDELRRIIRATV